MLRTALGASKHSRAFRRAMALELRPLRSYSVEQPPHNQSRKQNSLLSKTT